MKQVNYFKLFKNDVFFKAISDRFVVKMLQVSTAILSQKSLMA